MQNPRFIVYTGGMFSGKSSKMLAYLDRCKYQKKDFVIFKPKLDSRYSDVNVVTHTGFSAPANVVESGEDIIEHLLAMAHPPRVVAVDEAFMIPGVAEVLVLLYRQGIDIVVSSLDLSATGKPFAEVEKILPWATHVEKCAAVCVVCGHDAHFTHRKQVTGDEILVGGEELYEPRCWAHHIIINTSEKVQ